MKSGLISTFLNGLLLLILLALGITPGSAFAQEFQSRRDDSGALLILGPSCEALQKQVSALAEWKARLQEPLPQNSPSCDCQNQGHNQSQSSLLCTLDLTPWAPDFVGQASFKKPDYYGPNCWNTALVAEKILPDQRFSTPSEIYFWTHSSLCHELPTEEDPRPGDLITIRSQDRDENSRPEEIHGFIYLSPELAFSKNGPETLAAIRLQSLDEVYAFYGVTSPLCKRIQGDTSGECHVYANIYRCDSLKAHRLEHPEPASETYQTLKANLDQCESNLNELVLRFRQDGILGSKLNQHLAELKSQLEATLTAIQKTLASTPTPDQQTFEYWKALELRAQASLLQISFF